MVLLWRIGFRKGRKILMPNFFQLNETGFAVYELAAFACGGLPILADG